ncbi:hypothetical protein FisN_8Lh200 [Fistulifera solaris]|uniref:Uncharacterized protein n=1 Tax=Fistulifera solaris TaxID=1519565 RepID=A0A1Z5JNA6_FISSO|nr:hypothetical protein FisN_8Lh200 [Fistulifera solaris]|eukprot:GAX15500.1 hypothetical protein FisN_8Lh200 [Fistulifera solaris]
MEDDNYFFGAISDAEALLACHAFLRRKKRLEWTGAVERRRQQEQAIAAADEGPLSGLRPAGFFWEDRSQLPHMGLSDDLYREQDIIERSSDWVKEKKSTTISSVDDWALVEDEDELEEPLSTWESVIAPDETSRFSLPIDDEDEETSFVVDDFSAIDYVPSTSHTRRSQAALRRWSDPAWKEKWWNSRWGDKKPTLPSEKQKLNNSRQRRTEIRVRKLNPDELLASPEMAELSPDEIAEAIRTYRLAKLKRSRSRRKFLDRRIDDVTKIYSKSFEDDSSSPIPRDYFAQIDENKLREIQQKRSERAREIYKKRLENDPDARTNGVQGRSRSFEFVFPDESLPVATTPKEALSKINASLDAYRYPSIHDVALLLSSSRLAKRKETLVRILRDCFGLRGKCVPSIKAGNERKMLFVTDCPIDVLGAYVLQKLEDNHCQR